MVEFSIFQQELRWCEIPERTVGPLVVVDPHPCFCQKSCLIQVVEREHIKYLVTERAVEPFNETILMRLPFLDESQFNPVLLAPVFQGLGDKLRAVVNAKPFRLSSPLQQAAQLTDHAQAGQTGVDAYREDFAVEIIDDVEGTECFSLEQSIMDKVHRPSQVVMERLDQRLLNSCGKALLVFSSQVQFHFGVDAVNAFVIVFVVKCTQSIIHHPKTPATVQVCHLSQLLTDRFIVFRLWLVAHN